MTSGENVGEPCGAPRHFHPHSDPDSPPYLPDGMYEPHPIPAHTVKIPSENVLHVPLT